jgi:hypothetical protein
MTSALPNVAIELLQDLVTIGYLAQADTNNHSKVTRAIARFQRHAQRSYRMPQPDAGGTFRHAIDGICDAATAAEIRLWVTKKWVLPTEPGVGSRLAAIGPGRGALEDLRGSSSGKVANRGPARRDRFIVNGQIGHREHPQVERG